MSGLDIEGVLRAHETVATGLGEWCCKCSPMEWRPSSLRATHVAAVLREQIAAAMLDAWDRGWAARAQSRHGRYSLDHLDDPYRAELAALVAPSRVPGEET